mgnify:FL=1
MRIFILIFFVFFLISCGGGGGGGNTNNENPLLIKLYWDPPAPEGISGYKLYIGYETKKYETIIDVGNVTEKLLELDDNETYYIACTSYFINIPDNITEESDYSNEIEYSTGRR